MTNTFIFGAPLVLAVFLVSFAIALFQLQRQSEADRGKETKEHSERIYKDFEMYLKVVLGLSAAFGYIRFEKFDKATELSRQGLQMIGGISLLVMLTFGVFILCHLGSKIRRWTETERMHTFFWQEIWAIISMWLFSTGIWLAAFKW